MASIEQVNPYHLLQASFATGEIGREVANRVDLDKYQFALTRAQNVLVRPYGPVYKRPGTLYCDTASGKNILFVFGGTNNVDYLLEIGAGYINVYKNGVKQNVSPAITTTYTEAELENLRFTQSADTLFIASGTKPLMTLKRNTDTNWVFGEFKIDKPYFDDSLGGGTDDCTITPSGTSGTVTLTSNENIFFSGIVGSYVRLKQDVASATINIRNTTNGTTIYSDPIYVGESWKIITHETWGGTVGIEYSEDSQNWKAYRKYTSNKDYNVTESGSFSEGKYIRVYITLKASEGGTCTVDLTALPYTEEGYAKVTTYTDAKNVNASVVKGFGNTNATRQWAFSAWGSSYGYPRTVCFFQDRLCLGGNQNQPYVVWMSRTGDYNNFSVEKADGKITDDSAVSLSFVSRKQFEIKHLVPNTDLLVMTDGNEWIVSGNDIITPSNATPKMQDSRGVGNVEPILIGSKTVFVQGRNSVVRDIGYSYDIDKYGGVDLTLLDKQIIEGKKIIDAAYLQEPNSTIYFVRDDGAMAILTYVIDQKVYAWSTIKTNGEYESVAAIREGDIDVLYASVKRKINGSYVRHIEKFTNDLDTDTYSLLDDSKMITLTTATDTFTVSHLAGEKVMVLGDGRIFNDITVAANGSFKLPTKCKKVTVGLPYTMSIELPNVEIKGRDGTMQGRYKVVTGVILRLYNTLGGRVGTDTVTMDDIRYDEYESSTNINLFSGDKQMSVPIGGFNTEGRISIVSDDAYPFNLLAIVREVSIGG